MGAVVYSVQFAGLDDVATLAIQIITGAVIYTLLSKIFNIESFNYIFNAISKVVKRQKK